MKALYVVYALDTRISVINADSKSEALDIFAADFIHDEILNREIRVFDPGGGLLAEFYQDDHGHLYEGYPDGQSERLQQLNAEERDTYIHSWIEKNAYQFWADEPHFASEYLKEMQKDMHSSDIYIGHFSDAFLASTIKNMIRKTDWYDEFKIVKIDVTEHNHQVIYDESR